MLVSQNNGVWPSTPATPPAANPQPMRAPAASLRGRRSPRLIVLGLLCAVLGSLGISMAFSQLNDTASVVAMSRTVARGETVSQADLTVITIGAVPGIKTIPSTDLSALVGQTALVDLPANSLVGPGMVGQAAVPTGTSLLGLKLEAGRLPVAALPPGTRVLLVEVDAPGARGAAAAAAQNAAGNETPGQAARTYPATVTTAPVALPDGASWVMDINLKDAQAAEVAALAASGRLVVVRTN